MQDADRLYEQLRAPGISEVQFLVREMTFRLGDLTPSIHLRVYYVPTAELQYRVESSHTIRTAAAGERTEACCSGEDEATALRGAVHSIVDQYDSAVRQGVMPNDGWLALNAAFA
jgi:hypothetical protein